MTDDNPRAAGTGRRWNTPGRRVLSMGEAEEFIMKLSYDIEVLLDELHDYAIARAQAEHTYGLAKAKRNLEAGTMPGNGRGGTTTVDEREAIVTRDTEKQWLESLIAEAYYNTCKERIHAKRDELKALQTIAANLRAVTTTNG